ncbi:MAG: YdcF family protein [Clostridia bacterium]|nr:YdcF family protein [Clostridia bacterium]
MNFFDTLDKKPKVWNIAILTAIVGAAVAALVFTGGDKYALAACAIVTVYLAAVIFLLVRAFYRQLRYNLYSYNTIFYIGFAIFTYSIFITHVVLLARIIKSPGVYGIDQIAYVLLNSARDYILYSFPVVLIFSVGLCVSNISLIRHEGFRPVNLLGIFLSVLLVGGAVFLFFFDYEVSGNVDEVRLHDLICSFLRTVYLYVECMLIGTVAANAIAARAEPAPDRDFLIILGCAIRKDGTPTPLLAGRVDRAIEFYEKQKKKTGKELTFITSGGKGSDEILSESAVMKRYLIERGIPEERIVEEDKSADTYQNMQFSKKKIEAIDPNGKIAFSTTNFHVFRSGIFARRFKMRAIGVGAKTKWYFWPNASVREFACLLTKHKLKQAIIFTVMIAVFTGLVLIVYR